MLGMAVATMVESSAASISVSRRPATAITRVRRGSPLGAYACILQVTAYTRRLQYASLGDASRPAPSLVFVRRHHPLARAFEQCPLHVAAAFDRVVQHTGEE